MKKTIVIVGVALVILVCAIVLSIHKYRVRQYNVRLCEKRNISALLTEDNRVSRETIGLIASDMKYDEVLKLIRSYCNHMEKYSTSGCPEDFKSAYVGYLNGWGYVANRIYGSHERTFTEYLIGPAMEFLAYINGFDTGAHSPKQIISSMDSLHNKTYPLKKVAEKYGEEWATQDYYNARTVINKEYQR